MKIKRFLQALLKFEEKKHLRIMKLTCFLILVFTLQTTATVWSQNVKMNVDLQNKSLLELFNQIERNSDYRFFYSNDEVNVNALISLKADNKAIGDILDAAFKNLPYSFKELNSNTLLVEPKASANVPAVQQQGTVKGKVTDKNGEPLPGVSVQLHGTTRGTITDANGTYTLADVPEKATLVFSFIGMRAKEVPVGGRSMVDVAMENDDINLEEVVAVGYGVQKKVNLTGAIGIVDGETLENRPIANAIEGLQGTVAGLNITNADGAPGSTPKINIRGATSINGGSPLVLVDGTEMDLNMVNPDDIESLSVLKDAASSAIYGARAAYGVILVTTKSGKRNSKTTVTYNGNFYAARPTIIPEKADSYKYALYVNAMSASDGVAIPFNAEHLALIKGAVDGTGSQGYTLMPTGTGAYYEHNNTNWADLVFSDAAPGQSHNVTLSGGAEKVGYHVSLGYTGYDGVVKIGGDNYKRYNMNIKLDNDITSWLSSYFQVNFASGTSNLHQLPEGHGSSIFHVVWRARPILTPTMEKDGVEYPTFIRLNPVSTLELGGRDVTKNINLNTKAGIMLKLGDFTVNSSFTFNPVITDRVRNAKEFTSIVPWQAGAPVRLDAGPSFVLKNRDIDNYYVFDAYAQYEKTLAESHYLKGMIGFNQEWKTISDLQGKNTNLISPDVLSLLNASGTATVSDLYDQWAIRGAFFRLNYAYKERYLLEVNGRYDGSSRFAKDDRFGFFPSISAGWRISEEAFMQSASMVDNLKLRASYGSLGNQLGSMYPVSQYVTTSQVAYVLNGIRPVGIQPGVPLALSRTWETVSTVDIGVDATLFQKLDLTFDVYQRKTKDMLVSGDALPGVYGASAPESNSADLKVNGWEAAVSWADKINKDWSYNIGFSIADWTGEITRFENPTKSLSKAYYVGKEIGEIWGYETVGLFQSTDEIAAAPSHAGLGGGSFVAPGDVRYADLDNSTAIDQGENTVTKPGDQKVIGNSTPRYSYSIKGGLNYKNFDMSFFFQGIGKRDFWLNGPILFGGVGGYGNVIVTDELYDNVWSDGSGAIPENRDAFYFRPSENAIITRNTQVQTRYLQNAAYLRLKNVMLGYTLPQSLTNRIKIANCRFYVSAENLLTFTKLNPSFDPEVLVPGEIGQGSTSAAYDLGQSGKAYPLSKRVSLGVNITF